MVTHRVINLIQQELTSVNVRKQVTSFDGVLDRNLVHKFYVCLGRLVVCPRIQHSGQSAYVWNMSSP